MKQVELKNLPIDRLVMLKQNPQYLTPKQMDNLKASMQRDGFCAPILVRPLKSGKFEVVSGNHRFMSAKELGLKTIPCVISRMSKRDAKRLAINLNTIHGEPNVDALAVLLASYVEDTGDLTRLENLDAPAVQESIRTAVVSHVYRCWLFELGKRLESKAVSAEEAARLERDMKLYLDEEIRIDFGDQDLTRVEWDAHDGQSYIEDLFRRAYEILES